jgi:hypothetical protein
VSTVQLDPQNLYPDIEPALRKLDERALRERILPVLLHELEFFDGPREEGKDLLGWRRSPLDTKDWVGFVVKSGNLNAQVAHPAGIRTVLHQVEQVLDHEVTDPLSSAQSLVRECWVVTNGDIPGHALDEIASTLRRHHLDKAVRWLDVKTVTRLLSRLPRSKVAEMLELGTAHAEPTSEGSSS